MNSYDTERQKYLPQAVSYLLIAESPPPSAEFGGSRHFYRTDQPRQDDRLFVNTIKALYPETADQTEPELESNKQQWLERLAHDGFYMIEALETSLPHHVKKPERQQLIKQALPRLIERVRELANDQTKLILIKSNVFVVAAKPLRQAGFAVLNTELVDYPGHYNQTAYRAKLAKLVKGET